MNDRIAELAAMFGAGGDPLLDVLCSRILGAEPPDRPVPCACHICRAKARWHRIYRERPSTGTHAETLRRNRVAQLAEQLTA